MLGFKHLANLQERDDVSCLWDLHGEAGYGAYMRLLEVLCKKITSTDKGYCVFTKKRWGILMGGMHHHALHKYFTAFSQLGILDISVVEASPKIGKGGYCPSNPVGSPEVPPKTPSDGSYSSSYYASNPCSNSPLGTYPGSYPGSNSHSNPVGNSEVATKNPSDGSYPSSYYASNPCSNSPVGTYPGSYPGSNSPNNPVGNSEVAPKYHELKKVNASQFILIFMPDAVRFLDECITAVSGQTPYRLTPDLGQGAEKNPTPPSRPPLSKILDLNIIYNIYNIYYKNNIYTRNLDIQENLEKKRENGSSREGGGKKTEPPLRGDSVPLSFFGNSPAHTNFADLSDVTDFQPGRVMQYEVLPNQLPLSLPLKVPGATANSSQSKAKASPPKSKPVVKKVFSSEIVSFVTRFQSERVESLGNLSPKVTEALIYNCCKTVDDMVRLDGLDLSQIIAACEWAANDSFWSQNLCSLASLRTPGRNGRKKIQNICANYKSYLDKNGPPMSSLDALLNDPKFHRGIIC